MSRICPNHGPYDGSFCPYPGPHGDEDSHLENEIENVSTEKGGRNVITDEDVTELDQGSYDDLDKTELEAPDFVVLAILWVKEGRRRGRTFPIRDGAVIGRRVGDLILDDPKVSSIHAKFAREGKNFVIWDFGSANGTYVNGKKIRKPIILDENDLLKIGDTVFVVKLLEPVIKSTKKSGKTPRKKANRK